MRRLEVPYAADAQGFLADPKTAPKGQTYTCLQCQQPVILKRGGTLTPHFAHHASSDCSSESVTHIAAKMRLRDLLNTALSNPATKPKVLRDCPGWEDAHGITTPCAVVKAHDLHLPPYDEVTLEQTHGSYRLDVSLLHGGKVVAAFEVYHAHRVEKDKAYRLDIPWFEVGANAVLKNPRALRLLNAGQASVRCKQCQKQHDAHAPARQRNLKAQHHVHAGLRNAQAEGERKLAPVMRFTRDYLMKHDIDPAALKGATLIVKRCFRPSCRRALVLIDTREWVPHYPKLRKLLHPFKPKGSTRATLVNTCPYCQTPQGKDSFEEGDSERLSGYSFLEWLRTVAQDAA